LIDDDQDFADLYLMQLRRDGIPLEHTRTGADADTFVRTRVPALILADLRLPDVDGRELIERWADDSVSVATPSGIVSNTEPEENRWGKSAPKVQRYVPKAKGVLGRLSLEIRATLGLPYGDRLSNRMAG